MWFRSAWCVWSCSQGRRTVGVVAVRFLQAELQPGGVGGLNDSSTHCPSLNPSMSVTAPPPLPVRSSYTGNYRQFICHQQQKSTPSRGLMCHFCSNCVTFSGDPLWSAASTCGPTSQTAGKPPSQICWCLIIISALLSDGFSATAWSFKLFLFISILDGWSKLMLKNWIFYSKKMLQPNNLKKINYLKLCAKKWPYNPKLGCLL